MTVVFAAGIRGHYHESSDCFESPQKSYFINQATPKKYLPNFSTPPKILELKIQDQILRSAPSLEIRSIPIPSPGVTFPSDEWIDIKLTTKTFLVRDII